MILMTAWGCGGMRGATSTDDVSQTEETEVSGRVGLRDGSAPPANTSVCAVSLVTRRKSLGGDYRYVYACSPVRPDGTYALRVVTPPPDAIDQGGYAVAWLMALPSNQALGRLEHFPKDFRGVAESNALVYRAADASGFPWLATFPEGVSCGQVTRATSGNDTLSRTACLSIDLTLGARAAVRMPNWD